MGATAQFLAVSAARKAVADLTKGADKEADLSNLRLAAPIDVGVRSRFFMKPENRIKPGFWRKINREFQPENPDLPGFLDHSEHGFVKNHRVANDHDRDQIFGLDCTIPIE